ncbi:MAG: DNA mismatch endonuclease Vsr [Saprospiraceae bacterium]|nr:MAG: DNA mismatch endonuclease Vsr [Saprospiraceae bacterium]
MADVHKPVIRSYNMSRIRNVDTKPEMTIRRFLHANGFRYRLHDKKLPGKPDIVLKNYNTVIQVYGCFWHAHNGCKESHIPKSRKEYWEPKIKRTIERDKQNEAALKSLGWRVITIWECEIEREKGRKLKLEQLIDMLKGEG